MGRDGGVRGEEVVGGVQGVGGMVNGCGGESG
jgi:hypothetical protein